MTITYKNSGDWGAGTGRLTSLQADNNFWDLVQQIDALNTTDGFVGIGSVTLSGNTLTFHKTDSTTSDVTIPTATWTWRGEWLPSTSYAAMDLFSESGTIYQVLVAHTSDLTFDAGENTGGQDFYQKILDFPAIPVNTVTDATYTPILSDANSYIRCTNDSGCAITIPSNAEVAFSIGTELHFHDANSNTSGSGLLTIEASTGTTLNIPTGYAGLTAAQHGTIGVKKVDTDEWDIFGLLSTATA